MLFEVEDLHVSCLATESRCGMVYLEPSTTVSYQIEIYFWLQIHFMEGNQTIDRNDIGPIYEDIDDEGIIRQTAESLGLIVNDRILRNGNCLYNAVFDILKDKTPTYMRNDTTKEFMSRPDNYLEDLHSPKTRAQYINLHSQNGSNAGPREAEALAQVLQKKIVIYDPLNGRQPCIRSKIWDESTSINLGLVQNNHYWSLKKP
ncbi:MAG: hypothetical protein EZS28_012514 [Streblomastix strix]|uniref:OTU domain-containing protein n=1 Tax=Streblomastix strix TaxID=222440 RepID=A0A5J4WAH5_9EUKA|nr:MAG: hypothetical protein EZS28_012514 [Streblomastix strix]